MSQFINNPEHTFGFDTLQLHVGQESADPASDSRAVLSTRPRAMCSATPSTPPIALVLPTPVTSTAV